MPRSVPSFASVLGRLPYQECGAGMYGRDRSKVWWQHQLVRGAKARTFRVPKDENNPNQQPQFGATFTKAEDGHHYDIRVDRQGNVVERTDITALHAAQAAAKAPGQAPATPAPAPAPAPAPVPAPGTAQAPTE